MLLDDKADRDKKIQLEQLIETRNNIEHNDQIHIKYHGNEFYIYSLFPWPLNAFAKRKRQIKLMEFI